MTPLLFMGQEWSASTPFPYFTDLEAGLGASVTAGRRREFAECPEFSDSGPDHAVPDPQAPETFARARLNWSERDLPAHRTVLELYRAVITLRLDHPALAASPDLSGCAFAIDDDSVALRRSDDTDVFWIVVRFRTPGTVRLAGAAASDADFDSAWSVVLTTEEPLFCADPMPPDVDLGGTAPAIEFKRPGAVILRKN
jgi:maltooligosyltrehalose trehalohydrolase